MSFTPILGPSSSVGDTGSNRFTMAYSPKYNLFGSIWLGETQSYTVDTETLAVTSSARTAIPGLSYVTHSANCTYATVEDVFLYTYFQQHVSLGKLYGCIGTVSGDTISLGSSSIVYGGIIGTSYSVESITSLTYSPTAQKAVSFYVVGNTLYYTVITVSGGGISCGTATSTGISSVIYHDSCYNQHTGKILLSYGSGSSIYAANVEISGTSITISDTTMVSSSFSDTVSVACDHDSGKSIIPFRSGVNLKVALVDTNMSVISLQNAPTNLGTVAAKCCSASYDTNIKKVIVVSENSPTWRSSSITISDSTFSFKTPDVVSDLNIVHGHPPCIVYSPSLEKTLLSHKVYYNGTANTYIYLQAAQLDESAPRPFWTNFYSQSETVV